MSFTRILISFILANLVASLPANTTDLASVINNSWTPSRNHASSLKTGPSQNQSLAVGFEQIEYDIPNTSRKVTITIDKAIPLNPFAFRRVLNTIYYRLRHRILTQGDGVLERKDDPYALQIPGCSSITYSFGSRRDRQLTYKILMETFEGLKIVLDEERRWYEADFAILDEHDNTLGEGFIDKANHDLNFRSFAVGSGR